MKTLLLMLCGSMAFAQVNIPDNNLRNLLLSSNTTTNLIAMDEHEDFIAVDANGNGTIEASEAQAVYFLNIEDEDISSLNGIGHFTNLVYLNAMLNNFTDVNLSGLVNLETLRLGSCGINTLNVTGLASLEALDLFGNNLATLDVSTLVNLEILDTYENFNLSHINFGSINKVKFLMVGDNPITSLDVSGLPLLQQFECTGTDITLMDVSHNPMIAYLVVADNPHLQHLNVKNSTAPIFDFSNNPELALVCADAARIAEFEAFFLDLGQQVTVSSECALGTDDHTRAQANVYPNPTDGLATVACEGLQSIDVYTIDGRLVEKITVNSDSATVDISAEPAGLYVVKASGTSGVCNSRLIKQ